MSFGFAPGDIIAAVTLVAHIYEKCFTKAQAAGEFGGFGGSGGLAPSILAKQRKTTLMLYQTRSTCNLEKKSSTSGRALIG